MKPSEKLLEVFRYWYALSAKYGSPELFLVAQINRLAVIDYLEEPNRVKSDGNLYVGDCHRKSAYTWLFGTPTYFGNLEFLCDTLGPDLRFVRGLIVEAAIRHERISLEDVYGHPMLDPDPLCTDDEDGGTS